MVTQQVKSRVDKDYLSEKPIILSVGRGRYGVLLRVKHVVCRAVITTYFQLVQFLSKVNSDKES